MKAGLFRIEDKVIVMIGASGVLGGSAARYLSAQGARIAAMGRRADALDAVVGACGGPDRAMSFAGDATDPSAMAQAAEAVTKRFGPADVLINAAGGNMPGATVPPEGSVFDLDPSAIDRVMAVNYGGSLIPTLAFVPGMAERPGGARGVVINFSSMATTQAFSRVMGYSAAKAALDNTTRWLAATLARQYGEGIRVNAIAPGFFLTEQNRALLTKSDGSPTPRGLSVVEHTPFGRFGQAEELHGTLHWLCSDASAFVTGVVVPVDGGFSVDSGV